MQMAFCRRENLVQSQKHNTSGTTNFSIPSFLILYAFYFCIFWITFHDDILHLQKFKREPCPRSTQKATPNSQASQVIYCETWYTTSGQLQNHTCSVLCTEPWRTTKFLCSKCKFGPPTGPYFLIYKMKVNFNHNAGTQTFP
jgi:hypothetical protein